MLPEPLDVDEIIAIVLWRVGSGDSSRTIAWMFGVGVSTVRQLVTEVAEVITGQLGNEYLGEPTTADRATAPSTLVRNIQRISHDCLGSGSGENTTNHGKQK